MEGSAQYVYEIQDMDTATGSYKVRKDTTKMCAEALHWDRCQKR